MAYMMITKTLNLPYITPNPFKGTLYIVNGSSAKLQRLELLCPKISLPYGRAEAGAISEGVSGTCWGPESCHIWVPPYKLIARKPKKT